MTDIFNQTLVRIRAGSRTTRGGDTVEDWSPDAVTRITVPDVSVQPNFQNERDDDEGTTRATGYRVLSAPGTTPDITALDRLEYRGQVHVVTGEVAYWPDPHGMDHVEFTMTAWRGA